jgi:Protein of unknown function (DUF3631)
MSSQIDSDQDQHGTTPLAGCILGKEIDGLGAATTAAPRPGQNLVKEGLDRDDHIVPPRRIVGGHHHHPRHAGGVMNNASQVQEIEWLLRQRAAYEDYPDLGAGVLDAIDGFVSRFGSFPAEWARHAYVLWAGHTWLMGLWYATPRLLLISPEAGSGKTALLEIMEHLVPHPSNTGDTSPAYFQYLIEESRELDGVLPTLLWDEIDTIYTGAKSRTQKAADMRNIVDTGHRSGGKNARRIGKTNKVFRTYAALAMAGKMTAAQVPDTIRTRSVIIPMQWATPEEKAQLEHWDPVNAPVEELRLLREMLQCWSAFVYSYAEEHPGVEIPSVDGHPICNRDRDVWQPLLKVAQLAGGDWPERARVAAVSAVSAWGVRSEPSEGLQLLWEIKAIFDRRKTDRMFTTDLLAELHDTGRFDWTGARPQVAGIRLGDILRGYGVVPPTPASRDQRIGNAKAKGYRREWFEDAWRRYPPPSGDSGDNGDGAVR